MVATALALGPIVHAQASDFIMTSTPSNLCVNPGFDAVSVIIVQSVGGFAGTVNLGDSVSPAVTSGPTLSAIPSSVTLEAGQTISFNLTISTTTSTRIYTYIITMSRLAGGNFHQSTVQLAVAAGCSVGGSILPIHGPTLFASYAGPAILTGAILALGATLLIYGRHNKRSKAP